MSVDVRRIANKAEVVLLELSQFEWSGPRFRIVHRFRKPGTQCSQGEEIAAVYLVHRVKEIHICLPLALRLLFDYLATHRHLPQSSAQIVAGMRAAPFYTEHASGVSRADAQTRKISRSAVKEYVKRIRRALGIAFKQAEIYLDPSKVLVSDNTVGNEVLYRLKASIGFDHTEDLMK